MRLSNSFKCLRMQFLVVIACMCEWEGEGKMLSLSTWKSLNFSIYLRSQSINYLHSRHFLSNSFPSWHNCGSQIFPRRIHKILFSLLFHFSFHTKIHRNRKSKGNKFHSVGENYYAIFINFNTWHWTWKRNTTFNSLIVNSLTRKSTRYL